MRIAMVIPSNLSMAPYVAYYIRILEQSGIDYDVISWDRLGIGEAGACAFKSMSDPGKHCLRKIIDYYRYCRFAEGRLRTGNYDKVVVFTILNTLLLFPFLKGRYRSNYVFDIRDSSVAMRYLSGRMNAAVRNAAMVVISSHGYKQWLPRDIAYTVCHNTAVAQPLPSVADRTGKTPYRILTIGSIGYYDANRAMIEQLADSSMFRLDFVGSGPAEQSLKDFVARKGFRNVRFSGRYAKQDEPKHLEGAAMISILMDVSLNSKTLMSNRFYLSLVYGIPMIVDGNTEQARWVEKYDLGVIIERKSRIRDVLVRYLETFDRDKFDAGRRKCLQIVQQDTEEFKAGFKAFLSK